MVSPNPAHLTPSGCSCSLAHMRKAVLVLCATVVVLAGLGCKAMYTPPTPHLSGPDSGFVGIPVEFVASFSGGLPRSTTLWWSWDDTPYTVSSSDTMVQHTYTNAGTYSLYVMAVRQVGSDPFPDYYPSEPSNICTLRIVDSSARR